MKKISFILLSILTLVFLAGCSNPFSKKDSGKTEQVNFLILQEEDPNYPQDLKAQTVQFKTSEGFSVVTLNKDKYVFISRGEQHSGGFGIQVDKVENQGDKTIVYVTEIDPPKDSINSQVITFPSISIKLEGKVKDNVQVKTVDGKKEYKNFIK